MEKAFDDVEDALARAALLFDARLYFEVHELLEPHWSRARGGEREALQGLIQVAAGYQHLANDNIRGGRALLASGSAKLRSSRLGTLDLEPFAGAVLGTLPGLRDGEVFDWTSVPSFPRQPTG